MEIFFLLVVAAFLLGCIGAVLYAVRPGTLKAQEPRETFVSEKDLMRRALSATFEEFSAVNLSRAQRWHKNGGLDEWLVTEWTNAMAGEAGEVCNAAKKLRRIECGMRQGDGDSVAPKTLEEARTKIAKEIGDTYAYLDLCAQKIGWRTEDCIALAFDQISKREDFPERFPSPMF